MEPILIPMNFGLVIRDNNVQYRIPRPIFSIRNYGVIKRFTTVTGYIGNNGSGKSVNLARELAISYLIRGKKVYSNMDIRFYLWEKNQLVERRSTNIDRVDIQELAEKYNDCAVCFDEVNVDAAEARRAMSDINLKLLYIIQQKRKRSIDIFWSAVSEMDVDARLRSRTDIYVKCEDIAIKPGFQHNTQGANSELRCFDYSGFVNYGAYGQGTKSMFARETIWNKPWWNIFETWQIQLPGSLKKEAPEINEEIEAYVQKAVKLIEDTAEGKLRLDVLWADLKVRDTKTRLQIGKRLRDYGVYRSLDFDRRFYIKDPEFEAMGVNE